ncbi:EamA family transporter RarD [Rhodophyticola sp. CCM32]|uniref:EamA family transporter RarD n=1 Tax=Rhodophyticola sp. CCM32 TaxID=2916397 RepID=UPI00107FCE7D|nr:EamA family transporter RarD [Rhodophyticola sp. CCM32]QBY00255.1 EamA family transporter RarD [Rhodophyticola sp. CCM32]
MTEPVKGVLAMIGACTIWGLSPIFYKLLSDVPPLEVLAHRTLWSVIVFGLALAGQGRLRDLRPALSGRRVLLLVFVAAMMISANWFLFIFSIQVGRTVESALGYYIFPLVAVLIGAVVLKEKLGKAQLAAVGLAALAVTILTLGLGVAPWISLTLGVTFGMYGLLKRWVAAGPVVSVTSEVLLISPLALGYLLWLGPGQGAFGNDLWASLFLVLSGPLTALPLILFSYAAKRAAMSTIGLVQYLNPTLQFGSAVLILGERVTLWHAIAFPIIWVALMIYSWASLRRPQAPAPT